MRNFQIINSRALTITLVFILFTFAIFWQDRYSALINKAHNAIAGDWKIEEKLSLDAGWVRNSPQYSWEKKSYYTFLNWSYTNRKGMTFGIIFAALVLTLFSFIQLVDKPKNKYMQALYGLIIGTPLGVCSNCVAPISKSFVESGMRKISALAAMIASPTLNVVVLFMVFNIFPLPVAIIKISETLILILIILPILIKKEDELIINNAKIAIRETKTSWATAFLTFWKVFLTKLWYIFSRTVPLMIAGGLLGSIIANLINLDLLASTDSYVSLLFLSALGTFLPVPMAFDVFLSESMMIANAPLSTVTVLLTTLGTFSIFSFSIVWQTFSKKIAINLFLAVILLGFISGSLIKILSIHTDVPTYTVEILKH